MAIDTQALTQSPFPQSGEGRSRNTLIINTSAKNTQNENL